MGILVVATVVALIVVVRTRNVYLPLMLLTPLAAFMVFGSAVGPFGETGWNDYYGAVFMPFAFILFSGIGNLPAIWRRAHS